jgi:hypothetical protein
MNDLAVLSSAGVTLTSHPGQNPFHVVFQPAKPTLDAVLPTPGAFLAMCARHRRLFQRYRADVLDLIGVRHDAVYGPCPF